jgi:hypothetical protein
MKSMSLIATVVLAAFSSYLVGCASGTGSCCEAAAPAPADLAARDAELFDPIKALAGQWGMTDETGNLAMTAEFTVSSANSIVREIMFPGHEHEMTNVYHMDGPNLVITHYCAAGNQPRMIASESQSLDGSRVFHFKVDRVSNIREGQHGIMNELVRPRWRRPARRADHILAPPHGLLTNPTPQGAGR